MRNYFFNENLLRFWLISLFSHGSNLKITPTFSCFRCIECRNYYFLLNYFDLFFWSLFLLFLNLFNRLGLPNSRLFPFICTTIFVNKFLFRVRSTIRSVNTFFFRFWSFDFFYYLLYFLFRLLFFNLFRLLLLFSFFNFYCFLNLRGLTYSRRLFFFSRRFFILFFFNRCNYFNITPASRAKRKSMFYRGILHYFLSGFSLFRINRFWHFKIMMYNNNRTKMNNCFNNSEILTRGIIEVHLRTRVKF